MEHTVVPQMPQRPSAAAAAARLLYGLFRVGHTAPTMFSLSVYAALSPLVTALLVKKVHTLRIAQTCPLVLK